MIEQTTFKEAYNHTDPEQRAKWHAAILQRIHGHEQQRCLVQGQVLHHTQKKMLHQVEMSVQIKHNQVFHAHLFACGYSQIPDMGFTKKFAPVIHNVT